MKKPALALSAATLAIGIVATMLWQQLRTERAQLEDLRARITSLESGAPAAGMASAAQASTSATAALAASDASVAAATPAPEAASGQNPGARMQQGLAKGIADVLSSAEGNDMIRNQVRAALAQQYPDLAAELRMTPAEAEKFMDLLAKQASGMTGDALGMLTGGGGAAAQDAQRKMIEKQLESQKEISRFLGSKYPAWQEYQGTATARQQVSQLRALLGTGPDALSETQSRPLVAALGAEQARIAKEEEARMGTVLRSSQSVNMLQDQLDSLTKQNARLLSTASPHLNSNQLAGYKRMLTQQETMVRTILGASNSQGNAAAQGGAAR
jgi:hypothetical protein